MSNNNRLHNNNTLNTEATQIKLSKNFNLYVILLIYRFSKFEQLLFKKVVEFSNIHLYVYLFLMYFIRCLGKINVQIVHRIQILHNESMVHATLQ